MTYCPLIIVLVPVLISLTAVIEARSAGNITDSVKLFSDLDTYDDGNSDEAEPESSLVPRLPGPVNKFRSGKAVKTPPPDAETCRKLEVDADKSFKRLLMIGEDFDVPRNETELQLYCKRGKATMKLASKFGKCLKPFPRQVLNIIIHGGKKSLKEYCDATKGRTEILKHLECVTPSTSKVFYSSLEHGFSRIDYIADHIQDDDLLSTLCCTFHLIYDQTMDMVRHHCSKSPDSTVRFLRSIIDNIAKDVLDLGCSKWSSVNSCDSQLPQIMAQLRSINPPSRKGNLEKRFLIGPVVSIASRLVA